jgi:hypothetical protein
MARPDQSECPPEQVTPYVPPALPEAIVFAGDGQLIASWGGVLEDGRPGSRLWLLYTR